MALAAKQTGDSLLRRAFSFLAIHLIARPVLRKESQTRYRGLRITVHPGVFHPGLYFSSKLLADVVSGLDLTGKRVLDMGTGTGIIGMTAARKGAVVLSVDISEKAITCANQNIARNELSKMIRTRVSDLFENVPSDEGFDYVFWNPPFYPRQPQDDGEKAWNSGEGYSVIRGFAKDCARFLKTDGQIVIILSSDMDIPLVLGLFEPLKHEIIRSHRRLFEVFTIFQFSR